MKNKKWLAALIIYAALIAVCIIVIYAVPSVRGLLEKTYITEYGSIDITDEVSAYIVRDETVYVAAQDSDVNRLAEPNKLVKAGSRVVELTPADAADDEAEADGEGSEDAAADTAEDTAGDTAEAAAEEGGDSGEDSGEAEVTPAESTVSRQYRNILAELGDDVTETEEGYTQEAGYVSYTVDGAEAALRTAVVRDLTPDDYDKLTKLKQVSTPSKRCSKGDPVFRIIHNSSWYMVFYIDNKAGDKYTVGRTVYVDISGNNVPVKVVAVDAGEKKTRVILSCKMFFDGFFDERSLKTVITVASAEGLVVQDKSIVEKDGQKGVFIKNKLGEHKFRPISIKADDGEKCVVYADIFMDAEGNFVETISIYDEIVLEPTAEDLRSIGIEPDAEDSADEDGE